MFPVWRPTGSTILFQTNRDGNAEIYSTNADGSGTTNVSNSPTTGESQPDWSPDGQRIAYAGNTTGTPGIHVMNADGSGVTRLDGTLSDSMPAWSPDGSRIAVRSDRDLNAEIYSISAAGSDAQRLTNNAPPGNTDPVDSLPDWQPAGVPPINLPPQVVVTSAGSCADTGLGGTMNLGVSDPDGPVTSLTARVSSSNQTLLPDANIMVNGTGAERTLAATSPRVGPESRP